MNETLAWFIEKGVPFERLTRLTYEFAEALPWCSHCGGFGVTLYRKGFRHCLYAKEPGHGRPFHTLVSNWAKVSVRGENSSATGVIDDAVAPKHQEG